MPVSEDELDPRIHSSSLSQNNEYAYSGLSKAEQRKNNKPIMEKRRRARINQCLNELKALILDATNKDPARHTKLEKADILEMTVKHLQSMQRQRFSAAVASDPTVVHKFKTGFNECATEVSRYISGLDGIDGGVKKRLISHLSGCLTGVPQLALPTLPANFPAPTADIHLPSSANIEDPNNNDAGSRFHMPGLQLIPSRLPSGELALLLPNASTLSSLFPKTLDLSNQQTPHISAFTPVSKDMKASPVPEETSAVKYENSQASEVTSTSNDGSSFKSFGTTPKKPSSSSLLIPITELNADYKRDTYSLGADKTILFKPLTVYTDPSCEFMNSKLSVRSPSAAGKSPLDFSIKKETQESPTSTNRLPRKRPLEDLPCNVQLPAKMIKIEKGEFDTERSCSSGSNSSSTLAVDELSGGRDSMWRPW